MINEEKELVLTMWGWIMAKSLDMSSSKQFTKKSSENREQSTSGMVCSVWMNRAIEEHLPAVHVVRR